LELAGGGGKRVVRHPCGKVNGLIFDKQGRLLMAGWNSRTINRLNPAGTIIFTDPAGGLSYVGMGVDDLQQYLDFSGVYRLDPEGGPLTLLGWYSLWSTKRKPADCKIQPEWLNESINRPD
jgi:hypothetical protein